MKIIRWLLSHFFLILLIVTVIYCYMFWGNLIGKETPAGKAVAYLSHEFVAVDNFVNAVKQQQSKLSDKKLADKKSKVEKTPVLAEREASSDKVLSSTIINRNVGQNPVSISYSHNQMQIKQNSAGGLEVIEAESDETLQEASPLQKHEPFQEAEPLQKVVPFQEAEPLQKSAPFQKTEQLQASTPRQNVTAVNENASIKVANEQSSTPGQQIGSRVYTAPSSNNGEVKRIPDSFVPAEIKKQLDSVDERGKVLDQAEQSANTRALWIAARKSYFQRDYVLSEKSYQQVIDSTEDNYDAYGELGNVYFNQGKSKQAAAAYYQAAAILVRHGQIPRARSLMGLLRHLDEPKAIQLQQLIESASS